MSNFDLIIFDCDGVLVDSERLAVSTESKILAELGWPLTESEIITRFVGRSPADMRREIETQLGRPVDWENVFEARYREVFERELTAVPGVAEALRLIDVATCVASSGDHVGIRFKLALTGLLGHFDGRIFSAQDVERSKPAPDVFLHAAREMGADPRRCAVIEDSVSGVTAGVAAGMRVYGFSGSVTSSQSLVAAGATPFLDMRDLPTLLSAT
ncbi:MAG TPA: HAD family hydrolase [Acidimicrobiales bacterium]|nr:HAD family hydrolase [Acidimicrobiales bacterium]